MVVPVQSRVFGVDLICIFVWSMNWGVRAYAYSGEIVCVDLWREFYGWVCTLVFWPGGEIGQALFWGFWSE